MAKKSTQSAPAEREIEHESGREHDVRAMIVHIMGRFSDARCVLECAVRSLEQWRDLDDPDSDSSRRTDDAEVVCLRHALSLLADVYDELDTAINLRRPAIASE